MFLNKYQSHQILSWFTLNMSVHSFTRFLGSIFRLFAISHLDFRAPLRKDNHSHKTRTQPLLGYLDYSNSATKDLF